MTLGAVEATLKSHLEQYRIDKLKEGHQVICQPGMCNCHTPDIYGKYIDEHRKTPTSTHTETREAEGLGCQLLPRSVCSGTVR